MERIIYDRMAALDQTHWWYVARRQILSDVIGRIIKPPTNAKILEIGCGTGHNFEMLGAFGAVDGLEVDDAAREFASEAPSPSSVRGAGSGGPHRSAPRGVVSLPRGCHHQLARHARSVASPARA